MPGFSRCETFAQSAVHAAHVSARYFTPRRSVCGVFLCHPFSARARCAAVAQHAAWYALRSLNMSIIVCCARCRQSVVCTHHTIPVPCANVGAQRVCHVCLCVCALCAVVCPRSFCQACCRFKTHTLDYYDGDDTIARPTRAGTSYKMPLPKRWALGVRRARAREKQKYKLAENFALDSAFGGGGGGGAVRCCSCCTRRRGRDDDDVVHRLCDTRRRRRHLATNTYARARRSRGLRLSALEPLTRGGFLYRCALKWSGEAAHNGAVESCYAVLKGLYFFDLLVHFMAIFNLITSQR